LVVRTALAAAELAGRLTPAQQRSAKAHLRGLWTQCAVVEVSEALVVRAGDLAERHGLHVAITPGDHPSG
jgi:predicted nucleic acid-binding protein